MSSKGPLLASFHLNKRVTFKPRLEGGVDLTDLKSRHEPHGKEGNEFERRLRYVRMQSPVPEAPCIGTLVGRYYVIGTHYPR